MGYLLGVIAFLALVFVRPCYKHLKSGAYRVGQSVTIVAFLVIYSGLSWVGALAWEHKLSPPWSEPPWDVVTGYMAILTVAAIFIVPALLAMVLAHAVAGAFWILKGRPLAAS